MKETLWEFDPQEEPMKDLDLDAIQKDNLTKLIGKELYDALEERVKDEEKDG